MICGTVARDRSTGVLVVLVSGRLVVAEVSCGVVTVGVGVNRGVAPAAEADAAGAAGVFGIVGVAGVVGVVGPCALAGTLEASIRAVIAAIAAMLPFPGKAKSLRGKLLFMALSPFSLGCIPAGSRRGV